jgi:hypothetical protein
METNPPSNPVGTDKDNQSANYSARSMLVGGAGFSAVSVAGFSVWAFGGRWLQSRFGEFGLFAACMVAFLGSAGLLLFPLVRGSNRLWRFYKLFVPAFFAYAIFWCAAWFALKFGPGEWLGSLLGSIAFVAVVSWGFGTHRAFAKVCAILFICHSAGYFLGAEFMRAAGHLTSGFGLSKSTVGLIGELGWGMIYGAGFGAGLGYVFHNFQPHGSRST